MKFVSRKYNSEIVCFQMVRFNSFQGWLNVILQLRIQISPSQDAEIWIQTKPVTLRTMAFSTQATSYLFWTTRFMLTITSGKPPWLIGVQGHLT